MAKLSFVAVPLLLLAVLLSHVSGQGNDVECCHPDECKPAAEGGVCSDFTGLLQATRNLNTLPSGTNAIITVARDTVIEFEQVLSLGLDYLYQNYAEAYPEYYPYSPDVASIAEGVNIIFRAASGPGRAPQLTCGATSISDYALQFLTAGNHVFSGIIISGCPNGALLMDMLDHDGANTTSRIVISDAVFAQNRKYVYQAGEMNYTAAVQVNGAGVDLLIANTLFLQNAGLEFSFDYAGYRGAGAHALAVNLFQGGRAVLQGTTFRQNGAALSVPYSTSWVACTNHPVSNTAYAGVGYASATMGACNVQVLGGAFQGNSATLFSGLHVLCGDLDCNLLLNGTSVVSNQLIDSNMGRAMMFTSVEGGLALHCRSRAASVVHLSEYSNGLLTVVDSNFSANLGTALSTDFCSTAPSNVLIQGSNFVDNQCDPCSVRTSLTDFNANQTRSGPGVFVRHAETLRIEGSTFVRNRAVRPQGDNSLYRAVAAVAASDVASLVMERVDFAFNSFDHGGALAVKRMEGLKSEMKAALRNCVFFNNSLLEAANGGGASFVDVDSVTVESASFENNYVADAFGGSALSVEYSGVVDGDVVVTDSVFKGNSLHGGKGALYVAVNDDLAAPSVLVTITATHFEDNHARSFDGAGGAVQLVGAHLTMEGSSFVGNSAAEGGALDMINRNASPDRSSRITRCLFHNNHMAVGVIGGGAMALEGIANLTIMETNFTYNTATFIAADGSNQDVGGAILAKGNDAVEIAHCLFKGNQAFRGGAIGVQSTPHLLIRDTRFEDNAGSGAGVYVTTQSHADIWRCTFENGFGWHDNFVVQASLGRTGLIDVAGGGAIQVQSSATAGITSCVFRNNTAAVGGAILHLGRVEIDPGWFYRVCGGDELLISLGSFTSYWLPLVDPASVSSDVVCNEAATLFEENVAYSGAAVAAVNSVLRISNPYYDTLDVMEANTLFRGNKALTGGAISMISSTTTVFRSSFIGNTALPTNIPEPLAYPENELSYSLFMSMPSSAGCGSGAGGALCQSCDLQCGRAVTYRNITVSENEAVFGGGMFITSSVERCLDPDDCYVARFLRIRSSIESQTGDDDAELAGVSEYINNTEPIFSNNVVRGGAGGGLFANHLTMAFECTEWDASLDAVVPVPEGLNPATCATWVGNKALAGGFGDKVASSPFYFTVKQPDLSQYNSGEDIHYTIELFDMYGQAFITAVDTQEIGSVVLVTANDTSTLGQQDKVVSGRVQPDDPTTNRTVTALRLITHPGPHNVSLFGYATALGRDLPPNELDIHVRKCRMGEVSVMNGTLCERCKAGYYNIDPLEGVCTPCPDNAKCNLEGELSGIIVPDDGYFNSNPFSAQVHECASAACKYETRQEFLTAYQAALILEEVEFNQTFYIEKQCDYGYEGALCGSCIPGYGATSNGCKKCAPRYLAIGYVVLVQILCFVMIAFTAYVTLARHNIRNTADGEQDILGDDVPSSTVIKVFVSYVQIISILKELNVNYPSYVNNMLETIDSVVSMPGALVNVDCSFTDEQLVPNTMQSVLVSSLSWVYVIICFSILLLAWPFVARGINAIKARLSPEGKVDSEEAAAAAPSDSSLSGKGAQAKPNDPATMLSPTIPECVVHGAKGTSGVVNGANGTDAKNGDVNVSHGNGVWSHPAPPPMPPVVTPPPPAPVPPPINTDQVADPVHGNGVRTHSSCLMSPQASGGLSEGAAYSSLHPNADVPSSPFSSGPLMTLKQPYSNSKLGAPLPAASNAIKEAAYEGMDSGYEDAILAPGQRAPEELTYWQEYRRNLIVTAIITIFYFYENVVDAVLGLFVCQNIDAEEEGLVLDSGLFTSVYWENSLIYECYVGTHSALVYGLGIPLLIFFAVGIPVASAVFLYVNITKLANLGFLNNYGFIYREYMPIYFYWESIIMGRKLLFTIAANFSVNEDATTQILILMSVIGFALMLHEICQPYSEKLVSILETSSLSVTLVSLYLTVYLTTEEENTARVDAISTIIILINIGMCVIFVGAILHCLLQDFLVGEGCAELGRDPRTGRIDKNGLTSALGESRGKLWTRFLVFCIGWGAMVDHSVIQMYRFVSGTQAEEEEEDDETTISRKDTRSLAEIFTEGSTDRSSRQRARETLRGVRSWSHVAEEKKAGMSREASTVQEASTAPRLASAMRQHMGGDRGVH